MIKTFILSLFIINIITMKMYCLIMSKRTVNTGNIQKDISGRGGVKPYKHRVLALIKRAFMLDSLMRLNLFIVSYIPSHTIRNILYKYIFKIKMGKNVVIYYGAEIRAPWNLEIGEGSIIGDKSILDARNGIRIGKNVNLSTGVWIWTEQHDVNDKYFCCEGASVNIEDRCWCGPRTIILPGKTMREGSVLAAGAVLTKNTEQFSINGGIPAKQIGERNHEIIYELNGKRLHLL